MKWQKNKIVYIIVIIILLAGILAANGVAKGEAAKAAEGIDPAMLAKYKEIKQHCAQPIAKLVDGNRCGGCNMNLPQVLMGQIKQGAKSVECENCGRIVIVE